MRRLPPRFVALSPGDLDAARAREFAVRAALALDMGLPGLMLREGGLSDRDFLELAGELGARSRRGAAWFCVHDRAHIAIEVAADALHLGFRSLPAPAARSILPPSMALGISTHAGDRPEDFRECDYRIHGPVYDTPSKRGIQAPIGWQGVQRALAESGIPLLAIGGLLPEHFEHLVEIGAHGACARASVFRRDDSPADTVRAVEAWLGATRRGQA